MKKIVLVIAIIAAFAGTAFSEIRIDTLKFTDKDAAKNFSIEINYPAIEGKWDFNLTIENLIESRKNEAYEDIKEMGSDGEYPYEMFINYSVYYADDNFVSLVMYVYTFAGGAHGGTVAHSINYDLNRSALLKFSDLFEPEALNVISEYCINELNSGDVYSEDDWVKTGAAPKEENYSAFTITESGLNVIFQQYQVAPYSAGMPEVLVPKEVLSDYVRKDGILY